MKPVKAGDMTTAIQAMLRADTRLNGTDITRSELLNIDPSKCPWVGIYRNNSQFEVRALGYGAGARRQLTELVVFCQESDNDSGEEAEDLHETLVATVLDVLFSDTTLSGVVSTITLASIQYQLITDNDDQLMHTAEIHIVAETTTQ